MKPDDDEMYEAMGELYRDGLLDMESREGLDSEFSFTEEGNEYVREMFRENDDAVLFIAGVAVEDVDRPGDKSNVIEALVSIAKDLRDDAGVNLFRVIRRHPEKAPGIDVDGMPDHLIERFDPPDADSAADVDEGP